MKKNAVNGKNIQLGKEEKEAIDFINNVEYKEITSDEFYDNRDILLSLIEKQQEKIYRLTYEQSEADALIDNYKHNEEAYQKEIEQLANGIRVLGTNPDITAEEIIKEFTEKPITEEYMKEFKSRYISKDKIRAIIKELEEIADEDNLEEYAKIDVLKETLEENNND